MTFTDIPRSPTRKALRQFAGAWLFFFSAIGAYQYLARGHHQLGLALMAGAVVFGVWGLIHPPALRWIFVAWMTLAFPIGWVLSQTMLLLMFYVLLTPVALFFRLRGRDLLGRKPAPGRPSFWTPKQTPRDIRSYFRQY